MSSTPKYPTFWALHRQLAQDILEAPAVDVGEWQAIKGAAQSATYELEDVSFQVPIPASVNDWAGDVKPNRAWADEHFAERVGGQPVNPPPSAERWPFKKHGHAEHVNQIGQFSHTYPERFWPKWANGIAEPRRGIRFQYGDLDDVVGMLRDRPHTRQAYLPIWFPEDTGAVHGERVPCTLGYHFMMREDRLKIVYYLRSCDFLRHFPDDVYLAGRLAMWMAEQMSVRGRVVIADRLVMHISSLHIFDGDQQILRYQLRKVTP